MEPRPDRHLPRNYRNRRSFGRKPLTQPSTFQTVGLSDCAPPGIGIKAKQDDYGAQTANLRLTYEHDGWHFTAK